MWNSLRRVAIAFDLVTAGIFFVARRMDAPGVSCGLRTIPVVVAVRDIPEGAIVDRVSLVVAQWPAGTQPAGAYTSIDSVANRVTRVPVYRGEALVPGRLAPEGTGVGLEVSITPGKRGYSIRLNDMPGIAGLVQPNSRVDILIVVDGENGRVAKVFMENMRVLAMSTVPQRTEDGRPIAAFVATVEVTPDEAARLAMAMRQGQIQLVLRGYGDPDSVKVAPRARSFRA